MSEAQTHAVNLVCDKRMSRLEQTVYGDNSDNPSLSSTVAELTKTLKEIQKSFLALSIGWSLVSAGLAVYAVFFK